MKILQQRRWLLLLIPALLLAALLVTLALQGLVRQAIVLPLSYLFWLADLLVSSVPQGTFWALLLAVGVYITAKSLFGRQRRRSFARLTPPEETDRPEPSRLHQRLYYLQQLSNSSFAREKIAFELRRLIIEILAYQERESTAEIERRVHDGTLAAPPEVHLLLKSWQTWLSDKKEPNRSSDRLSVLLPRWVRSSPLWQWLSQRRTHLAINSSASPSPYERKVAAVIDYMENQLNRQQN
jgi:hypothetical protein